MRRLVPLLVVMLTASGGCFVMDELDQGSALMDQHGGGGHEADASEASSASASSATQEVFDQALDAASEVQDWWADVRAPAPSSDPIIECHHNTTRSFTTESDCLARGGWVRP